MNDPKMTMLQERWKQSGIPEGAGTLRGAPSSGGMSDRFAKLRSGQMRDEVSKFTRFNTNNRGNGAQQASHQGATFNAIPEVKVGKDNRPLDTRNPKVEVENFNASKSTGNGELDNIAALFGGGGGRNSLNAYNGGQQMGYNQAPQMSYQQNNDIDLDQMYAQKGASNFDPRQMIIQNQQRNPQQQQLDYNNYNQQDQQDQQDQQGHQQGAGYNPNMPMEQQIMQQQYGQQYGQQAPNANQGEYMQYSQQHQHQQHNDPRSQMEEIARSMTLEVLSEYKKQEKKNQLLTKVRHNNHENLVKDHNGQHYLMEFNKNKYMVLKPVKMTNKS
jgi:hypothetical protein|tara:strand:+ start:14716 stop:15702 length:987 start_codon:yes stop_codon:yes gene_type:complete